jgi:hypothetical protein
MVNDNETESNNVEAEAMDRAAKRKAAKTERDAAAAAVMALVVEARVTATDAAATPDSVECDARADIAVDAMAAALSTTVGDHRRASLRIALIAGADVDVLREIACASRVARHMTIALPAGRYAHLSRGRNWQRRSDGVFVDGEVGAGRWTVGSTDGFNRKDRTEWKVKNIQVGDQPWTVAS